MILSFGLMEVLVAPGEQYLNTLFFFRVILFFDYSLEGFLQENGPFLWQWGTAQPVSNPYAWNTLANVLWVEQPVGTGFSQGTVTIQDENGLA